MQYILETRRRIQYSFYASKEIRIEKFTFPPMDNNKWKSQTSESPRSNRRTSAKHSSYQWNDRENPDERIRATTPMKISRTREGRWFLALHPGRAAFLCLPFPFRVSNRRLNGGKGAAPS